MKKSKHFRKDVIMARVIAGVLVIVLIVLLVLAVSILTKPSGSNKDTQNTQNTQSTENTQKEELDVDISTEYGTETEFETELESESESESESEAASTNKTYVITTSPIRLRKEPNTECATIELLEPDVKLEVLETLDGWYKVSHNGQEGYVSATYVEVEES